MKTSLTILLLGIGIICSAQAQKRDSSKQEKIKELQAIILTEKLALTEEEKKNFLPLYYQYKDEERALAKKIRRVGRLANNPNLTEEEANKILNQMVQLNQEKAALFAKYVKQFKTVLPATKVAKIYVVEREINRIILQKIKERKKN